MGKRVMVIGSGAREHALAWKLVQSPALSSLFSAPGNPGTAELGQNMDIGVLEIEALTRAAVERRCDLVVVGPEAPLAAGLADQLNAAGIPVFGPTEMAARIESSKAWAKSLMLESGVPTAAAEIVTSEQALMTTLDRFSYPLVVKADGLAAGKGVIIAGSRDEALTAGKGLFDGSLLGVPSDRLVIEEFLEGREVSLLAVTDGTTIVPLLPACDYKRALDDDGGLNTGGMGAYAPVPQVGEALADQITRDILQPVVAAMGRSGAPMQGVLYAGLMLTESGPKVLEFNARFGDPETQVLLPLLESDLLDLLHAVATGGLQELGPLQWSGNCAVGVVLASGGYPGKYPTGLPITGALDSNFSVQVFHAGTASNSEGTLVTAGGRVLTVVGQGETFESAARLAYDRAGAIHFEGKQFRTDIARRELRAT